MIIIADKQVSSLNGFSKDFFSFLEQIKEGYEWLTWATTQTKTVICNVIDERELLLVIQNGLHADDILKYENFQLDIQKALSLDILELNVLQEDIGNAKGINDKIKLIQAKSNLISNAQLTSNKDFLTENKLSDNPIFQGLTFHEKLTLYNFKNQFSKSKKVKEEAKLFALDKATNVDEFCSFYQFYMTIVTKYVHKNSTIQQKNEVCSALFTKYNVLCNYLIQTPNVGIGNTDKELQQGLIQFVKSIKFIGYKTKAVAMYNLALNVPLNSDNSIDENGIEVYMKTIREKIIALDNIPMCQLTQDGQFRTFSIQTDTSFIQLEIDKNGNLYLSPDTTIKP